MQDTIEHPAEIVPVPAAAREGTNCTLEQYTQMYRRSVEDADAFWAESARVGDAYNVCGLSALATLAEILPPSSMTLLAHDIMRETPTLSAVSFAAAAFCPK